MGRIDSEETPAELSFNEIKKATAYCVTFSRLCLRQGGRMLKRHALWLIVLFLLIMGYGSYRYYHQTPVYEGTASYIFTVLHKKVYGEMTDKLAQLIAAGSYEKAGKVLGLPAARVKTIRQMTARNIYGSKLSEDITEKKVPFYITITATNDSIFNIMAPALIRYFNSNPIARQRIKREKAILSGKISYAQKQLDLINKLTNTYSRNLSRLSGLQLSEKDVTFNPVTLFDKSKEINDRIVTMETELPTMQAVQLLNGFMVADQPIATPAAWFLFRYFIYYLLTSLIILVFISIVKSAPTAS